MTRALLPADAPLGLAVSGGADSLGLLAAAVEAGLAPRACVLHVDHGTGAHAARAGERVAAVARALDLTHDRVTLAPAPARGETALRRARLAALGTLAERHGLAAVLLAHHAADQRETVALRLLRGHRGPRALAGVPCLRPLAGDALLLRPLLVERPALPADALARAVADAGLEPVDDPTNADLRIPRNAVRAWLATPDGRACAPRLDALARHAARRLARLRVALVPALEHALQPCGHGARVDRAALAAPPGVPAASWLAELLRLVGASLDRPRAPRLPRGLLDSLARDLERARPVRRRLPAAPAALELLAARDGLHLPREPLAPGPPAARLLAALARLPWEAGAARG